MVAISNTAANSAVLSSLRQINKNIAENQTRIGTGLKISKYSDNPALFATAQSIRSDIKIQDSLAANIGISKARADAANAGLDKIAEIINKIIDVSSASDSTTSGSELSAATGKIAAYLTQIGSIAASSGFQGKSFLTSAVADTVKLSTETSATVTYTGVVLTGVTAISNLIGADNALAADVVAIEAIATTALADIITRQAGIGAFSELLGSQLDFQTTLKSINETALGSIVDADLEEEAARTTALQVQQQLAYQALSIGNSSAQNILRLFQ